MISGLHSCKPGNTPNVGQVKCFAVTEMTGKSGNPYTRIQNTTPDKGGQYYTVMTVAATGFTDAHGNVSFNLDLEPATVPVPQQNATQTNGIPYSEVLKQPISAPNLPGVSIPQDSVKQHLMRSANLYALCVEAVDTVIRDRMHRRNIDLHEQMAWFQGATTTLFLHMKDRGYIAHMSDREEKPKQEPAKEEPF